MENEEQPGPDDAVEADDGFSTAHIDLGPNHDEPRGKQRAPRAPAASQSFNADEVNCMDSIFKLLLRGGDARQLARSKTGKGLMKKCESMHRSIARQKGEMAE